MTTPLTEQELRDLEEGMKKLGLQVKDSTVYRLLATIRALQEELCESGIEAAEMSVNTKSLMEKVETLQGENVKLRRVVDAMEQVVVALEKHQAQPKGKSWEMWAAIVEGGYPHGFTQDKATDHDIHVRVTEMEE